MKKNGGFLVLVLLISIIVTFSESFAQQVSIEDIKNKPYSYNGNVVEVDGLVLQYVYSPSSSSYYLLKGNFGGVIKINSAEATPETNQKYHVRGIVYFDSGRREIFITEISRSILGEVPSTTADDATNKKSDKPNYLLIGGLAGTLLILVGVFVFFSMKKPKPEPFEYQAPMNQFQGNNNMMSFQNNAPMTPYQGNDPAPTFSSDTEFKTIRFAVSSPKTLLFIPGKMVITDGADKDKTFKIAGYPTANGSMVTIGRKEINGERAYAHIQLKGKTVSREQAELTYKEGKLYIKNLSETNFTQLDGRELNVGEIAEMKPDSKIRTGEVEFEYKL